MCPETISRPQETSRPSASEPLSQACTKDYLTLLSHAERNLDMDMTNQVRQLLDSDKFLFESMQAHVTEGQGVMRDLVRIIKIARSLKTAIQQASDVTLSDLYVKAVSGGLAESPFIREIMLSIKKASSDVLSKALDTLKDSGDAGLSKAVRPIMTRFDKLRQKNKGSAEPLRSEHDVRNDTLRTTVVAQKVELSKQKASFTQRDSEYSKIVDDVHGLLEHHLANRLTNAKQIFMYEVVVYDLKGPHRDSLSSKPRFVIERALSSPHDYLNCACCKNASQEQSSTLLPSNPPTSMLYQLYLESGALINVADMYSAFKATLADKEGDEKQVTYVARLSSIVAIR
jgi:origin recognition complex subunit 3